MSSDKPDQSPPQLRCIPRATYRLQFNRDFTFQQARGIATYLRDLGISDVYSSPLFQAGPESTHGYDICCFGRINSNIGSEEDFDQFMAGLRELGLGLLLDMVPNHMGAAPSNVWWVDVLEKGRDSEYATFFDINWEPENPMLKNKVLLPVLEDHYARVLESGQLKLGFESGRFFVGYHDQRYPIANKTISPGASHDPGQTLAELNGRPGEPGSFEKLEALIEQQHYRLAYWKTGSQEINYRRFFDVTELVSMRMELPEVFVATHERLFDWLASGKIFGLRIDHPDGLWNPKQYFERLQAKATSAGQRLYVVVEKILSGREALPEDWPVAGTTGYDFLNRVNGLFISSNNESALDKSYREFIGRELDFRTLVYESKKQMLETSFVSELKALTRQLCGIAAQGPFAANFAFGQLEGALKEVIAAFPVYRTYLTRDSLAPSSQDQAVLEGALAESQARNPACQRELDLLRRILTLESFAPASESAARAREFIMKFQQLTGPVMAKGLEDTAFYNYHRLISLNEVGGDPGKFGVTLEEFHLANARIAARWPHTLLATATHDTKRGEDARARINVLSEIPEEWQAAVVRWKDLNADKKVRLKGQPAPAANDEYLLYQSLVGALPVSPVQPDSWVKFRERAAVFMLKAIREAKTNTSWVEPDLAYETAVGGFVERILTDDVNNRFLPDLRDFTRRVAFFGKFNSLSQTLLKITSPGVPDFYQGTELWDFSFVDPDNRRAVDFDLRLRLLAELPHEFAAAGKNLTRKLCDLLEQSDWGRIKLYVVWRALELRHRRREIFEKGSYTALSAAGSNKDHVCAFVRSGDERSVVSVAPRLVCGLTHGREITPIASEVWGQTFLPLPHADALDVFENVFTGETVPVVPVNGGYSLELWRVLNHFPVALLESQRKNASET
jgi:(1->4)-alpha-D-glucan 1-alpha-D-glucosylmutase